MEKVIKKTKKFKTINLKLFPIDSEVSQYEINKKINDMANSGWNLVSQQIYDECNIILTFIKSN